MNHYLTAKNDRRRRRIARMVTAAITLSLLVLAAYSFGAFDSLLAPTVDTLPTAVAKV